jgi:hypothetical protein
METDYTQAPSAPPNVMIIFGAGADLLENDGRLWRNIKTPQ